MALLDRHFDGGNATSVTAVSVEAVDVPQDSFVARMRQRGVGLFIWVWAAIWMIYLIEPLNVAWHKPHLWQRLGGTAAAVVFSAAYVIGFVQLRKTMRRTGRRIALPVAWGLVAGMGLLVIPLVVVIGESGLGAFIYVGVMAVFTLPTRTAAGVVAVLVAILLGAAKIVHGWAEESGLALQLFVSALAVYGVMHLVQRNAQLAAAKEEIARLAVNDERNRFARDLHDLLGHTLTVVSVKAELAGRLLHLSPERAEAEIADIQRLTREALADVRAAVGGYREISLGAELVRARSALDAAQIEPEVPLMVDQVPEDRQELFGWAVREGVTNVIRHSGARKCRIDLRSNRIEICDDGRGPGTVDGDTPGGHPGHGLAGLRERASAAGASIVVGRSPMGGFLLRLVWAGR
jgi:two-component system sensor histidine kinase DesK